MKYIILIGDGMGDYPIPELGGKTPLEAARTPNLDKLAVKSLLGTSRTIPEGLPAGSDVANMALMGYDPKVHLTGRAPLEAASLKLELKPDQVAFRCNLVILGQDNETRRSMIDYCSGHINTTQSNPLIQALQKELGSDEFSFHLGTSYRHLLIWNKGRDDLELTPPHDVSGQSVDSILTKLKKDVPELYNLTRQSWEVLGKESTSRYLKNQPNSIWLWGQGKPPALTSIPDRFGIQGSVISAVDLLKGLGIYAGLEVIEVPGASGWLDTNYEGKVKAGLKSLKNNDFLYLHIEAPDEAGHSGILNNKLQGIEDFDAHVVGPLFEGLEETGPFRLIIACDHYTPLTVKSHTSEPVPVMLYDSRKELGNAPDYSEKTANKGRNFGSATEILTLLLEKD